MFMFCSVNGTKTFSSLTSVFSVAKNGLKKKTCLATEDTELWWRRKRM